MGPMFAHLSRGQQFGYAGIVVLVLGFLGYWGGTHAQPSAAVVVEPPGRPDVRAETKSIPGEDAACVVHVAGAVKKPGVYHLPADARLDDALKAAGGALADADTDSLNLAAKVIDGTQIYVQKRGSVVEDRPKRVALRTAVQQPPRLMGEIRPLPIKAPPPPKVKMPPAYQGGIGAPNPYIPPANPPSPSPSTEAPSRSESAPPHRTAAKGQPTGMVSLNSATSQELETLPGIGPATATKILDYRQSHGGFRSVEELIEVKGIGPKKMEKLRPWVRL